MKAMIRCCSIICIVLLFGCSTAKPDFTLDKKGVEPGVWYIYEGVLPCADCSEIKTRLELFVDYYNPEPPFILKQAYIGKKDEDQALIDHGIYGTLKMTFRNTDMTVYELNPGITEKQMYFLRINDDTLQMLDRNAREINSTLNYNLVRTIIRKVQ